jgi:hypothetical protein
MEPDRRIAKIMRFLQRTFTQIIMISFLAILISIHCAFPQSVDPVLTPELVRDLPFVKPEITLQHAITIAEASLKRQKIDLNSYFLLEAKFSHNEKNIIGVCWYLKWVKWGVKQSANTPLEITVSMEGKVSSMKKDPK